MSISAEIVGGDRRRHHFAFKRRLTAEEWRDWERLVTQWADDELNKQLKELADSEEAIRQSLARRDPT